MDSTTTVSRSGPTIQRRQFIILILAGLLTAICFLRWADHVGKQAPILHSGNGSGKLAVLRHSSTAPALRRLFRKMWYKDSRFKGKCEYHWAKCVTSNEFDITSEAGKNKSP
ncbi:hypothetical protein MTO96_030129 [Rhipicephalus appendiculatus]